MMDLNKVYSGDLLYETEAFSVERSPTDTGYQIRNRNTEQVEAFADHETSAVLTALWLQESYEEVMEDPVREYARRKAMKHSSMKGPQLVQ